LALILQDSSLSAFTVQLIAYIISLSTNYSWRWTRTASETCRVVKNKPNKQNKLHLVGIFIKLLSFQQLWGTCPQNYLNSWIPNIPTSVTFHKFKIITNRKCTYRKTLVGHFKNSSQKYDFPSSNDSIIKIRKET